MDAQQALRVLRAVDHTADIRDADHLIVDGRVVLHREVRSSATRWDAERILATGEDVLLTPDSLTPSLLSLALKDDRVILVTEDEVVIDRERLLLRQRESAERPRRKPGPRPYARFALARALLASRQSSTQSQLAESAGITQGTVTKALASELFDGLLVRGHGSTSVGEEARGELFDRIVDGYPGPGGITTYWWKDTPPLAQAKELLEAHRDTRWSGDVLADSIRHWRRPEHAVVYSRVGIDPRKLGYAMAQPGDYTLMLVLPEDPTIEATARAWDRPHAVDPIITAYDVLRTGTTGDEMEAVSVLRDFVVRGVDG